jgi:fatty acid desaturase
MELFRYKEDRLPTFLIVGLFCLDLLVFFLVDNIWLVCLWLLLTILPKICICPWNHHHQHVPTFRQTWLNRLLEIVYAMHTGITTNAWVLHHVVGHHINYLDQTRDESGWKRKDGSTMGLWEYTFTIALTGYPRAFKVAMNYPRYLAAFLGMGALTILILAWLIYLSPLKAFLMFVIPMMTGYLMTCWHTYFHHAGLDTDDHLEASYNIMHRWYNIATGNLGYHTAHHMKQGLHWSRLPQFHAQIADSIPSHLYRKPCFPFNLLPGD